MPTPSRTSTSRAPSISGWASNAAALAGFGFTMGLFIGTLAFGLTAELESVRLAVLSGSAISALAGVAVLWASTRGRPG